jgi:F5/8 type C domain-containing protein
MDARFCIFVAALCLGIVAGMHAAVADGAGAVVHISVQVDPKRRLATVTPFNALGSTVDKEPAGSIPRLYSKANIKAMLGAGLGWLSYRLFTELSDQDWHWNPAGSFSAGDQGYWTSSSSPRSPLISDSFGYRLPHRGNTTDQGNNASYSRIDDGDPSTYWKSDPYLAHAFTGDADTLHPQWVVVDLGHFADVDQVRIAWANPYATSYTVDGWTGDDPINDPSSGEWSAIAATRHRGPAVVGSNAARGPADTISFAKPTRVRYLRIFMTASSDTCDTHGPADKRNCVGYAIAELSAGTVDAHGAFLDLIYHAPCGGDAPGMRPCGLRQTATYVSSVDPWHEAADRVRDQEQPGLDLIARSGLTHGRPAMYPVAMLYSTPENAVAEIHYLRARGYPIMAIELGEEPDGQYTTPEDDAALYLQWARAIHRVFPDVRLGGPVFSGVNSELQTWPDAHGNISWLNRFLNYLRAHDGLGELAFMSFEHYPFNGCEHGAALTLDLLQEPSIIKGIANQWRSDGLPADVPMYITEANFSAVNFSQTPMLVEGALWQADYMASSLASGITGVVYYQYEPVPLSQNRGCPADWGNLTMFVADAQAKIRARGAQYFASQMLTRAWLGGGSGQVDIYAAASDLAKSGYPVVTAYAAKLGDDAWSIMLVNKDAVAHQVSVSLLGADNSATATFIGPFTVTTFGQAQYLWHARGAASLPNPAHAPVSSTVPAASTLGAGQVPTFLAPALSITVLRGRVAITAHLSDRATRRTP